MGKTEEHESPVRQDWTEFVESQPDFPATMWKWLSLARNLVSHTPIESVDDLGFLIHVFLSATIADLNDVLTLSHSKSRSGRQNFFVQFMNEP